MATVLKNISKWIHKVLLIIAEVALIAMVIIVSANVFMRYVLNTGVKWVEEVPSLLVAMFAYIAMAIGVRDRLHISVSILYNLFPKDGTARKVLDKLGDFVILLCGLFMLIYGMQRVFMQMKFPGSFPMTGWPVWIAYVPIPLVGIPITLDSLLYLFGILKEDDLLYGEAEVDYDEIIKQQKREREEQEAAK